MAHDLEPPPILEALLMRLDELAIVVGPGAAPRLGAVRAGLTRALALKVRGDVPAATQAIACAMQALASLADGLDPEEATMMRAVAQHFGAALARGATDEMTRASELMRDRSGARSIKRPGARSTDEK
jgi:hypothetical protein